MIKDKFYDSLRKASGSLSQSQVDGLEKILAEGIKRKVPLNQMANILAQVWHETGQTCQPIREYGAENYLKSKKYYPWVGEGLIQVTWEVNHRKFGATAPGQLLTWPIALRALFDGMLRGMFTKYKLSDFVNETRTDYKNARKVVNGLDKADLIEKYSFMFENALSSAKYGIETTPSPVPPAPEPPDIEYTEPEAPPKPKGILMAIIELIMSFFKRS